jgi:hypothetical protein
VEIINSVFSWIIKKRIHQMELFMKYPHESQQELLLSLISKAKNTEWGKKHGYESVNNYQDFINQVPLQNYESLKEDIDRIRRGEQNVLWPSEIKWFAKSSGTTTGKSKFIPVSKESLIDCHYKGGKDLLAIYHHNHPESKLILGKTLVVGGSSQLNRMNSGSYSGDLSAIIMKNFPLWVEQRRVPKLSIALMDDWERKIDKMVKTTANEDVSNISGVPSWTLVFLKRLLDYQGKQDIQEVWPNLELYMHGGVNFGPYKTQFDQLLNGTVNYYENYNASEGFFGIQDLHDSDEMLLMLDYGIFYEFIEVGELNKESPKAITLDEVKLDTNYAIVITTNAGLWRYVIGDTVKFTSLNPYRIQVTGRTKQFINAFGEELIVENAERALNKTCTLTNAIINEFTVAPAYISDKKTGKHEWLVEFDKQPEDMELFTRTLDEELKRVNSDYEAKRQNNLVLELPTVNNIEVGTFYQWMKEKKKLGGQHKIPRLSNDRSYIEELLKLV